MNRGDICYSLSDPNKEGDIRVTTAELRKAIGLPARRSRQAKLQEQEKYWERITRLWGGDTIVRWKDENENSYARSDQLITIPKERT